VQVNKESVSVMDNVTAMSFAAEEVWRGGDGARFSALVAASWRRGGARLGNTREKTTE
jgi:hypothetical protein